jgi:predicted acylesterase/phospholipase RssA
MPPRRSLVLAGGGLKVCFQAGVLQVWMDEAGLSFDHADGASGGCFNLAMYCQGLTGRQIADNWRNLDPFLPVDLNVDEYWRLGRASSLFTYDNFRAKVLPFWGIDWPTLNASSRLGTFNVFNYTDKRLEIVTQDRMTEDYLISSVSLPMWFPPVEIGGKRYFDAVYICDANVEEAIRRGADEIWAIWTVSTRDEWRSGFIAQYFHIIETVADTNFFSIWRRIEESNARIAAGEAGEFGRTITLRLLQAEVPVHYLINFSRDRMAEAVNLGVKAAREWCDNLGIPLPHRGAAPPPPPASPKTRLQFTERMRGFVADGETDFQKGFAAGRARGQSLDVTLTIKVGDLDRFVVDPDHRAEIEGTADCPGLGGGCLVTDGEFQLLVHDQDPARKSMRYWIHLEAPDGSAHTLGGFKDVHDDPELDLWRDTTTLYTTLYAGRLTRDQATAAPAAAAGIIEIHFLDFLRQLTTFRVEAPTPAASLAGLTRFGQLFLGKLWDVYGRDVLGVGAI